MTTGVIDSREDVIRTRSHPDCYACGTPGKVLYQRLTDRQHGVSGVWSIRRCPVVECQLVWLDPVPVEEDLWKAYQPATYYTHGKPIRLKGAAFRLLLALRDAYLQVRFGYTRGVGPRWYRRLYPLALVLGGIVPGIRDVADDSACHLAAPLPGGRLLEVGFGSGDKLIRMREFGWDVCGVDLDPTAVRAAQAKRLDARLGDLAGQSFPDRHFDAVYLSHLLEHVHDPDGLLQECYRVLKPGGALVALMPNVESRLHQQFGADWPGLDPPRHLVLFSRRTLRIAVERAGFSIARLRTSSRLAALFWIGGTELRRYGEIESLKRPPPLWRITAAVLHQYVEYALTSVRPDAGSEIVLIARKSL